MNKAMRNYILATKIRLALSMPVMVIMSGIEKLINLIKITYVLNEVLGRKWKTRFLKGLHLYKLRAQILSDIIRIHNVKSFIEVGVWKGDISVYLLERHPDLQVICVDPWDACYNECEEMGVKYQSTMQHPEITFNQEEMEKIYNYVKQRLMPFGERARIIRGDSATALSCIPPGSIDMVFIDELNTPERTKKNILRSKLLLKKEGIITGRIHWYCPQLKEVLNSLCKDNSVFVFREDTVWFFYKEDLK